MIITDFNFEKNKFVKILTSYIFAILIFLCPQVVSAQKKDRIEVLPRIIASKNCKSSQSGQVIFYLEPDYPLEAKKARVGGAVDVTVKVDTLGKFLEIEKVTGNRLLQGAAMDAASKVKFTPTICGGALIIRL